MQIKAVHMSCRNLGQGKIIKSPWVKWVKWARVTGDEYGHCLLRPVMDIDSAYFSWVIGETCYKFVKETFWEFCKIQNVCYIMNLKQQLQQIFRLYLNEWSQYIKTRFELLWLQSRSKCSDCREPGTRRPAPHKPSFKSINQKITNKNIRKT